MVRPYRLDETDRSAPSGGFQLKKTKNPIWRLIGLAYKHIVMEGDPKAVAKFYKSGAFGIGSPILLFHFSEKDDHPRSTE